MNTPCQSAGRPCGRQAVAMARIFGVGDRPLCLACMDVYRSMGLDFRLVDATTVPEWRQRSLARDLTRMHA